MTPAEAHSVIEERCRNRQQIRKDMDNLNAKLCDTLVKAPYFKDPVKMSALDFLIFGDGEESNTPDMTPDAILDRAFDNLSKAGE